MKLGWPRTIIFAWLALPLPVVLIVAFGEPDVFLEAPGLLLGYIMGWIGFGGAWNGRGRIADAGMAVIALQWLALAFLFWLPLLLWLLYPAAFLWASRAVRRIIAPRLAAPMPALQPLDDA